MVYLDVTYTQSKSTPGNNVPTNIGEKSKFIGQSCLGALLKRQSEKGEKRTVHNKEARRVSEEVKEQVNQVQNNLSEQTRCSVRSPENTHTHTEHGIEGIL